MSEKVTFKELIDSIASQTDNSKKFTHDFLKDLVSVINSGLEKDGKVNIAGFGKFELRQMDQREGYNPQTREKITIPEHNKVVFKPYKDLRELVNAPYLHLESEVLDDKKNESALPTDQKQTPDSDSDAIHPEKEKKKETDHRETGSASAEPSQSFVFDESVVNDEQKNQDSVPREEAESTASEKEDHASALGGYIDKAHSEKLHREKAIEQESVEPSDEEPSPAGRTPLHRPENRSGRLPKSMIAASAIILMVLMGAWFLMTRSGNNNFTTPLEALQQPQQNEAIQESNDVTRGTTSSNESSGQTPSPTPSATQQGTPQNSSTQEDPTQLTIDEGQSLWSIASHNYRDPYLWPWIYDANKDSISNPNLIVAGKTLSIPMPDEQDPGLSSTDSLEVALGYVETYHWYKENQNEDARLYLWAAKLYDQDVFDNVSQPIDEEDLAFANGVR